MKKPLGWLSLFLIAILPLSGFAESLPLNTFSQTHHWKQTYNAHNRSIEIDIEIAIPEKMEAAILTARDGDSSLTDEQLTRYAAIAGDPSFNPNNSETFLGMGVNNPFTMLPGQKNGRCKTWMLDLNSIDVNTAYAENNPVTLGEAWDIFTSEIEYCYGQEIAQHLVIDQIMMRDRLKVYDRKTKEYGEALREYGSYQFTALQVFYDMPLLCHVSTAFDNSIRGENTRLQNLLIGIIANEESFDFRFSLVKVEQLLSENSAICGVEDAISALESFIDEGRIRNVYTLKLAYVLWNDASDDELFYMVPCWVAECDYYSSAKEKDVELSDDGENYTDKTCYQKTIVNALTGEILDPENSSKNRSEFNLNWI